MLEEHQPVAQADLQCAPELALRHRPEDEPDDHRRHWVVPAAHEIAADAECHEHHQLDGGWIRSQRAHHSKHENARIEPWLRHLQQAHPQADKRQVQHQQHQVANEEAGDQPPDEIGVGHEEQRTGHQPVLLEARKHHRGSGRCGKAERQQRHQRAGRGRVVGRLRARHPFDRTFAELLGLHRELALERVRQQRRHFGAARGQRTDRETQANAAQPRLP
ncbi:hypothetical protein D3C71_1138960 [compost metagenome]